MYSLLDTMNNNESEYLAPFLGSEQMSECFSSDKGCLFADVLRGIDVGVILVEPATKTLEFCNAVALNILGLSSESLNYQKLEKCLHPVQSRQTFGTLTYTSQAVQLGHHMLGYSTYPVSETHLCILIRDITEKTRLESIAQAVNTMDNIGMIFSGIRHEMGNPLNSIKMTISVLEKNIEYFSRDTISKYIERMVTEVARMEYMLKSLKNFSMFEKLEISSCDLVKFLENFQNLVLRDFEQRNITLNFEPSPEGKLVMIDPRALNQALLNILANAVDSLEGRALPTITLATRMNEKFIWLEIRDNGCGMSDEQQKYLFHPFYTNKTQGNGLGLVITQKLLAKMNASIVIRSWEGVGTVVEMVFPLATATTSKTTKKTFKESAFARKETTA
ncbi:MAG: HAMP domain-containing histidine kinase [Deltaproteobacteria bacterium]|nr:HAMP domain-containing histidine kinase [Deltaproteobacteria bacterium]